MSNEIIYSAVGLGLISCFIFLVRHHFSIRGTRDGVSTCEKDIKGVQNDVRALLVCSRGMASRVDKQQMHLQKIAQRQDKMEFQSPSRSHYGQASAMARKGASADELMSYFGVSRGEAELIIHLNRLQRNVVVGAQKPSVAVNHQAATHQVPQTISQAVHH
jgi:hypothetical protein